MPLTWNQYQAGGIPPGAIVQGPGIPVQQQPAPVSGVSVSAGGHPKPTPTPTPTVAPTSMPAPAPAPTPTRAGSSPSDNKDIRNLATKWAVSEQFTKVQLEEFEKLMDLVTSTYISSDRVVNVQELGRGSFGKIYYSKLDNGPVAVKVIAAPGESHNIKAKMRELLLELNILVRVRHPNVVTFWGTCAHFTDVVNKAPGQGDPSISMVFELCDGGSLQQNIFNPQRKLTTTEKISFGLQIAYGMAYLHRRRADDRRCVIHRDLNTRNILITSDGVAKVADFGCARVLDETGQLVTTTISGTPAYMAPEQMLGESLTEAVDVFSFAVVLWEMMVERRPWEGPLETDFEGIKNMLVAKRQVLPIPGHHRFPPPYIRAVQSGMALQAKERPSMFEMVDMLREAQQLHAQHPLS